MSSVEPEQYANHGHRRNECIREFVITGGDGAELLEFAEEPLDQIALTIEGEIGFARGHAVGFWRNDWRNPACVERADQGVGIVSFVGQKGFGVDLFEQRLGLRDVGRLPGRQRQGNWIADGIDDCMNFGRQSTARTTDRLVFAFFFWAPALCWCARTAVESSIIYSVSASIDKVLKTA